MIEKQQKINMFLAEKIDFKDILWNEMQYIDDFKSFKNENDFFYCTQVVSFFDVLLTRRNSPQI